MTIAYISSDNPQDLHGWSGLTHHIARSLAETGNDLKYIHSFSAKSSKLIKLKQKLYPKLTGKFIQPNRYPVVYEQFARQIEARLAQLHDVDFVFSNSTECVAGLDIETPIALWLDACFAGMIGYYPEFDKLHSETIRSANQLEQSAFDKAKYIFFASDWAAQSALKNYKIVPEKIKVIPFGANVGHANQSSDIQLFLSKKSREVCRLLFAGVYWERKGGDIALKVTEELNNSGIKTELIIVGCKPFEEATKPDFVHQEGFLSKKNPAEAQRLEQLYKDSHFLIVPSKAECYGLVYCEANSYGLPAMGTKTGGVPTIIKDGINGAIFNINCPVDEYVAFIRKYFNDQELYNQLALSSFNEYATRLNWEVAGNNVIEILQSEA